MKLRHSGPLLVVEDGDEDFDLLQMALRRCGVTNLLIRRVDGDAALAYLQGDEPLPLLILLDLNLAGTDGREVLRELRREPHLRTIPVMVWSTSNNPRDINFCYREGANCYAVKPVGLEKFERLIELFSAFWLDVAELPGQKHGESYDVG